MTTPKRTYFTAEKKDTLKLKPIIDKSLPTIKLVLSGINHARRVKQLSSIFFLIKMRSFRSSHGVQPTAKGVFNRHLHPFIQSISIKVDDAESWRMSTRNAAQSSGGMRKKQQLRSVGGGVKKLSR